MRWYILIHQIPPRPLYLRAKIRRRLGKIGAIPLKNSVYVLPHTEDSLEDFQWLAQEIEAGGGEAFIGAMSFLDAALEHQILENFRAARAADYTQLAEQIQQISRQIRRRGGSKSQEEELSTRMERFQRRFEEIRAIDFFETDQQQEVQQMLAKLADPAAHRQKPKRRSRSTTGAQLAGRVWVTRRGVKVDRIATAWLVRRFIDENAQFRLVDAATADVKRDGEMAFDILGGDFTHQGDLCTFESLLSAVRISDPALQKVAEIVHDIDLKDDKFARPETAGIRRLLDGLLQSCSEDQDRFARGFELFDNLYESFRGEKPQKPEARRGATRK